MGKLGIFDEEKKKWIQFDEDSEILIKFLGREELRNIGIKAEKTARLTGADSNEISNQKIGRAAVLGWRKIEDHNHPGLTIQGAPVAYTPENLDMLMRKSYEFSRFVNENVTNSKLFLEEEETPETKNAL